MANFVGIAATLKSIERHLNSCFEEEQPISGRTTKAVLARTTDFESSLLQSNIGSPALSIFLYRVDFNKTMRAAWSAVGSQDGFGHLAVDLHLLLTAWGDNAEFEFRIIGKAMQCIETTPLLSGPMLDPSGNWAPNETVQLVLEDISTEAVMRTFDSLPTDYRLSIPYIARIVRIDSRVPTPERPVTTLVTGIMS
jgi:Pvc16 N-terminal domain